MPERVSIPYHATISAGAEGELSIYKVPGGRSLRTVEVSVYFPVGQYGELHLSLLQGIRQVLPTVRDYTGDNMTIVDNTPAEWGTGEDIILHYKNDNATEVREGYLTIEAELIQPGE